MTYRVSRIARLVVFACAANACGNFQLRSPIAPVAGPPATFSGTTSDTRGTRVLEVREGVAKATAFKAIFEYLGQRFAVDVRDEHAGFLMTTWQASSMRSGVPDLRYRTRVVVRFLGDEWRQVSIRVEANWQRGEGWDIGYDTKILDDASTEIQNRVGKK